jgi:hypothetical protein
VHRHHGGRHRSQRNDRRTLEVFLELTAWPKGRKTDEIAIGDDQVIFSHFHLSVH